MTRRSKWNLSRTENLVYIVRRRDAMEGSVANSP